MTLATLAQLHDGLVARLQTISGLRVLSVDQNTTAPCVKVGLAPDEPVNYWQTFTTAGDLEATFLVRCFAKSGRAETAREQLYGWMDFTGSTSIRAAIDGDRTLGGVANDTHVSGADAFGVIEEPGDAAYWGVDLSVTVIYNA